MPRHTIEASEKPLLDIFCNKYLFEIPSYQRPYAWTTEQAGELLDDIDSACGVGQDIGEQSPYFLGSIVLIKDPANPKADVVDGQQRLTTLTILLSVLRDLAPHDISQAIQRYICQEGDPIAGLADVFRLTTRERDADFFRQTIQVNGATAQLPDPREYRDARARMVENAKFLRDSLLKMEPDRRRQLTQYIARRCFLVVVAASDQESAFRIFSVMNSRGLDLSPADILKADIIGAIPENQQEKYTETWESLEDDLGRERFTELFGHIRMIHRRQKMKETLISELREHVAIREDPISFIDQELSPYANAFGEIITQAFVSYAHADEINHHLTHLARLDNVDWQPPAIVALARHRSDPAFILHFLRDLDRLAYGLFLMRGDNNERIRRYGRLLNAMSASKDLFAPGSPLQLDDQERKAVLAAISGEIYTSTRVRLPLLLRLDEYLSGGSAVYDHKIISVEHVLPQNPKKGSQWTTHFPAEADRQRWVHRLANLVLLTRRKNAQAGNLDFAQKKAKYFASKAGVTSFALTSQVLAEPNWTPETLERRQRELTDALARLWRL